MKKTRVLAHDFFMVARCLYTGLEELPNPLTYRKSGDPFRAFEIALTLTFLAGQILENVLKSYLAFKTYSSDDLKRKPFGHNLEELWKRAKQEGLDIEDLHPHHWCLHLNKLHDVPYKLRYPSGDGNNVLPDLKQLYRGIKDIFYEVNEVVGFKP